MSALINAENEIDLTRGDTLHLSFTLTANGEPYELQSGDVVRFALKKNWDDPTTLITKNADNATQSITLEPADTKSLSIGTYVYDIQLTTAAGVVDTFIRPAKFTISKEVD